MGVLDDILKSKLGELPRLRRARYPKPFEPRPVTLVRSPGSPLQLVCEIKFRSPSAGELSRALTLGARAQTYQTSGARMISILCDQPYFGGCYDHLKIARDSCDLPLLCKEFIIDECQLDAAVAHGADVALLIVRCLDEERLISLISAARERGLLPLVEVHGHAETRRALDAGADVIGVNARDLNTLKLDPTGAKAVLDSLPNSITKLHLSGLKTADDVLQVAKSDVAAALIGETLMRQDDPAPLLKAMALAAQRPGRSDE